MTNLPSPNFGERRAAVRPTIIVIHYTAMANCAEARTRLCEPEHQVSAHWLIGNDASTEQLVDEAARAWHAGAGSWASLDDINSHSIGIEMDNPGDRPFSNPQMLALTALLPQIMARWDIPPHRVIAHSDMSPDRKIDPGARFDWRRLARQGLSVWPDATAPADPTEFSQDARSFGYPDHPVAVLLPAFRRRFRPAALAHPAVPDGIDAAMAHDLARRYGAHPQTAHLHLGQNIPAGGAGPNPRSRRNILRP
jgi:N-acetylmuramoyl-L-alanine amidase